MNKNACKLYLITPSRIDIPSFKTQLLQAFDGGAIDALQLRLKGANDDEICRTAEVLLPIIKKYDSILIMNDRPDLAKKTGCDGVHIGQNDTTYSEARKLIGRNGIIGVSCHNSKHLAMVAAEKGADYVAFGAFFPTITKNTSYIAEIEIIKIWNEVTVIPCVAIGGINHENCGQLITAGVDYIAAISSVWGFPSGPKDAVNMFHQIFHQHSSTDIASI